MEQGLEAGSAAAPPEWVDIEAVDSASESKVLDASQLKPGESLAGRDLRGWTLKGDFSGRDFVGANLEGAMLDNCNFVGAKLEGAMLDNCNLRRVIARCANLKDASLKCVDASRADLRGACLTGAVVGGAKLRRVKAERARMAGMWYGACDMVKPEVKPLEEAGGYPLQHSGVLCMVTGQRIPLSKPGDSPWETTPLAATDEIALKWAAEETKPIDENAEAYEDVQDEEAWQKWKEEKIYEHGDLCDTAILLDMQHMNASHANMQHSYLPCVFMRHVFAGAANMQHMDMGCSDMQSMYAEHSQCAFANFGGNNMKDSNFCCCNMLHTNLGHTDMQGIRIRSST
eukprot:6922900-Prymnesium_polylepis.1